MTYLHLTRCLLADPGYLPNYLKTPLNMPSKTAPLEKVRLFNMRLYEENNIYSFATLDQRATGDVGGDLRIENTSQDEEIKKLID